MTEEEVNDGVVDPVDRDVVVKGSYPEEVFKGIGIVGHRFAELRGGGGLR